MGRNKYFKYLDVLRFIAIFLSFLHHSNVIHFVYGHTFFFVLSGFILTYQANNEIDKKGSFNWMNFTMRRILRIFPLYFIIIFVSYFLISLITVQKVTLAPIAYYLTFTSNYCRTDHIFILVILWSVAVQEQFYLFISLCYRFLVKYLMVIAAVMIVISLAYKVWSEFYQVGIYFHTLNHFSSFGIGIFFAQLFNKGMVPKIYRPLSKLIFVVGMVTLFLASFFNGLFWFVFGDSIVSVFFAFAILFLCSLNTVERDNLFIRLMTKMGKFSYGLYCFQGLIIVFGDVFLVRKFGVENNLILVGFNFIILTIVAYVSYELIENKILNLKRYFR